MGKSSRYIRKSRVVKAIGTAVFGSLLLASCGGGEGGSSESSGPSDNDSSMEGQNSDNSQENTDNTNSTSTVGLANCPRLSGSAAGIAGLYEYNEENRGYVEILTDGVIVNYLDQQGPDGTGENCHEKGNVGSNAWTVNGNSVAAVFYENEDADCQTARDELSFTLSDTELTVSYVDDTDDDEDGNTTEILTESVSIVRGLSVQDIALCE